MRNITLPAIRTTVVDEERPWPVRGLAANELGDPRPALDVELTILPALEDPRRDRYGRFRSRRSEIAFHHAA